VTDGVKYDQGKRDWTLLPWDGLEWVVKVLEYGAAKYTKTVDDPGAAINLFRGLHCSCGHSSHPLPSWADWKTVQEVLDRHDPACEMRQRCEVLEEKLVVSGRGNWRHVPNSTYRYLKAMIRHIVAFCSGEINDPESGLPHLAHAGCCLLFLLGQRHHP
jgi:hypothetical protein